jgi:hypothetical protein
MRVIVTGATGYIGSRLVAALRARGDTVTVLTRDAAHARAVLGDVHAVAADLESGRGAWTAELAGAGAIAHLAGEPIAGTRWDARQKQILRDSRVEATRGLVEAIATLPVSDRPAALVSASGVDYYPYAHEPMDDDEVTEADPPADSFLGRLCRDWEREALAADGYRVRTCCLRTGVVIGPGGALAKMSAPFKRFAGGKLGHGRQWMSWISLADIVALYLTATTAARYAGPINAVAPEPLRNADFARALGRALHRPSWLPVPGFALRAALGEFGDVLLHGRRVVPRRLEELGFAFAHPRLADALATAVAEPVGTTGS